MIKKLKEYLAKKRHEKRSGLPTITTYPPMPKCKPPKLSVTGSETKYSLLRKAKKHYNIDRIVSSAEESVLITRFLNETYEKIEITDVRGEKTILKPF